ncbi:MAG: glycosyl hydrolase family 5 [Natronohydrobacter sp.]|nr:glycosyl hydrolase family 5 [Natronohydrobacter sp.]
MKRRDFLITAPTFSAMMLSMPAQAALQGDLAQTGRAVWESWKSAFLSSDGRVIDGLQQQSSHSEGQGYGMFLATVFDDAASFRQMFQWTERHLAVRSDALLAWRWLPGQANPVPDRNNASDGDLFYAWALVRAAARFRDRSYLERAQEIAAALAATCILPMPGRSDQLVFLPATFGFQHDSHLSVNPSYYMPLAMREVAAATGTPALAACAQSGETLMHEIARDGLVPDWIDVAPSGVRASETLSANAGYEALRVPLFLIWSRVPDHMAVRRMAAVYERTVQPGVAVPTVIEPLSGVVLESSADPGYQALAGLTVCSSQRALGATIPPFSSNQPYYPATLQLFAMVAVHETLPECVPL